MKSFLSKCYFIAPIVMCLLSGTVNAGDLGYRYSPASNKCLDDLMREGNNPDWICECGYLYRGRLSGDLSGRLMAGNGLREALVSGANMKGVDLRGSILGGTSFQNTVLEGGGPSTRRGSLEDKTCSSS